MTAGTASAIADTRKTSDLPLPWSIAAAQSSIGAEIYFARHAAWEPPPVQRRRGAPSTVDVLPRRVAISRAAHLAHSDYAALMTIVLYAVHGRIGVLQYLIRVMLANAAH